MVIHGTGNGDSHPDSWERHLICEWCMSERGRCAVLQLEGAGSVRIQLRSKMKLISKRPKGQIRLRLGGALTSWRPARRT